MKKRSLAWVAVWSILTLGIYTLVWLVKTKNEMNKVPGAPKVPSVWIWIGPVLVPVVSFLVYLLIMMPSIANDSEDSVVFLIPLGILYFMGILASIGLFVYWTYRYAVAAEFVTKGAKSKDFYFWFGLGMYLLSITFVWSIILQDDFNKVAIETPVTK